MFKFGKKKIVSTDMKGITPPEVFGYLNPLWEIEVVHQGKTLIKMPFCNIVHTYLKDYGFEPDKKTQGNVPKVIIRIYPGSEVRIPLFIKMVPDMSRPMTPEYAKELGMLDQKG